MAYTVNRRNMLTGGLITAAAAPLFLGASARGNEHVKFPQIGNHVFCGSDGKVFGLYACRAYGNDEGDDLGEKVAYSDNLLKKILYSSYQQNGDPREIDSNALSEANGLMNSAINQIMELDRETVEFLGNAELYWVQNSPVFLYGIGRGIVMALQSFTNSFSVNFGRGAAGLMTYWVWKRLFGNPEVDAN